MKTHWWHVVLVVATVAVAAFAWDDPYPALFSVVPVLLWCWSARSAKSGIVVGLVLLALQAWFTVPRAQGFAGRWVPAAIEVYWLYPVLAAVVCAIGARRGQGRLWAMVLAGFAATGVVLFSGWEAPPGDEGISPGPDRLRTAQDYECGSGNCWRVLKATGDHAPDVMRGYLADRNFTPAAVVDGVPRFCRTTGLVVSHEVCAELRTVAPDAVRVEWYVQ